MSSPSWYCQTVPTPRIGVSACLVGQRVRYDGTDKRSASLYKYIGPHAELIPLCPEAALGIPRPPVHLQHTASGLRAIGVEDASLDVTDALHAFNDAQRETLGRLCGVILKARSPSCGIGSATHSRITGETQLGDGLFAGFIRNRFPWLPLCDEETLEIPEQAKRFLYQATLVSDAQQAIINNAIEAFLQHHKRHSDTWHVEALLEQLHRDHRLLPE